jgi:hypothetical protein
MHESTSEVELIARHRIQERITGTPVLVRTARPRRRTAMARTLRRVADRLDG